MASGGALDPLGSPRTTTHLTYTTRTQRGQGGGTGQEKMGRRCRVHQVPDRPWGARPSMRREDSQRPRPRDNPGKAHSQPKYQL